MGYLNSKGEPYSQTSMAKFLSNPRYKGYYTARLTEVDDYKTHKKKKVEKDKQIIEKDDRIPAIVSEELWDKANALHEMRKKHPSRNNLNREEMLENSKYSCKIYCKHCGSVYIRAGGSNRATNPTWSCKKYKTDGVGTCASPILKESYLDKIFIDIFTDFLKNKKDYLDQVLKEYKDIIINSKNTLNIEEIAKKLGQLDKQKDKLLDLSIKGMISDSEFQKRNDRFNFEIAELNEKKESFKNESKEYERFEKGLNELKKSLSSKLDIKEELPFLMRILVDRVEIEKINDDRKHVRMVVYFNFNTQIIDRDLELYEKSRKTKK
jgi:hypothetical protein